MTPRSQSCRVGVWGQGRLDAFTLIEVMLVIGIMAIVLAMGLPPMVRTLRKEPIRQAAADIEEGLKQARAQAILSGGPAEFVLQADPMESGNTGASISVQAVEATKTATTGEVDLAPLPGREARPAPVPPAPFQAHLHPDIRVTLLEVNLVNQMASESGAHVRFFPNGTSDDFAIVLEHSRGVRKIQVDPVTGLPDMEVVR